MPEAAFLGLAAFAAGAVDAVMGGGGMIQVPALFAVFPALAPAALLGTNKISSLFGTAGAAFQYARARPPRAGLLVPVLVAAFVCAAAGALLVVQVPAHAFRLALPFVLLGLLVYVARTGAGMDHAPRHAPGHEAAWGAAGAGAVGFYDGVFGPGAGAFFKLVFVRLLGFDFLNAAAPAKLANIASNLAAIAVFAATAQVLWPLALFMAVANFLGGQVGARIALRFGNRLMRRAFLVLVAALALRAFYDAYWASNSLP